MFPQAHVLPPVVDPLPTPLLPPLVTAKHHARSYFDDADVYDEPRWRQRQRRNQSRKQTRSKQARRASERPDDEKHDDPSHARDCGLVHVDVRCDCDYGYGRELFETSEMNGHPSCCERERYRTLGHQAGRVGFAGVNDKGMADCSSVYEVTSQAAGNMRRDTREELMRH